MNTMEKDIRKAVFGDIEKIANIISVVWREAYRGIIEENFLEERTVEKMISNVKNSFQEREYFVYEENNIVKGFISGKIHNNENCEIIQLYVGLEFQGKNIGTELLNYMKIHFKYRSCTKMTIWTLKNIRNNSFYVKNGGKVFEEKDLEIGDKKYPGIGFIIEL